MTNNTNSWRSVGKLDHLKLMYNKTIDELIKDEFEGFSGIFILAKLKNFILKFMPEYMNFLVYKKEQNESFNPETFGFKLISTYSPKIYYNHFHKWQLNDYTILTFNNNFCRITVKDQRFDRDLFFGKIPSYSFAFELFKNLGISK